MMPVKKLNRLPGVFSDLFYDQWPEVFAKRGAAPAINVIETDKKYKVEIAAPGMTKDDFRIELNADNQLVVCMEKATEKDVKEGDKKECCMDKECDADEKHHYLRREFTYASYRQVFNLPENVDRDNIKAKMKHGVLHIKLPKKVAVDRPADVKLIEVE
ncbi:MAG: Hsp20/alpha crystallin family protein [Alistipes sp.]|nr:Hsp20/alpha crystallin family protein [Alistipes sp.]